MYHFITLGVLDTHGRASLVDAIQKLISLIAWNVKVSLVFREANVCADKLAKHGHDLHMGTVYDSLPPFVSQEAHADSLGRRRP